MDREEIIFSGEIDNITARKKTGKIILKTSCQEKVLTAEGQRVILKKGVKRAKIMTIPSTSPFLSRVRFVGVLRWLGERQKDSPQCVLLPYFNLTSIFIIKEAGTWKTT